jgi:hypothetical protein
MRRNHVIEPQSSTTRIRSALKIWLFRPITPSTLLHTSTWRHIRDDLSLGQHRCENLKLAPALPCGRDTN